MSNKKKQTVPAKKSRLLPVGIPVLAALLCMLSFFVWKNATISPEDRPTVSDKPVIEEPEPSKKPIFDIFPDEKEEEQEDENLLPEFEPFSVDSTAPSNLISTTGISVDGNSVAEYSFEKPIDFGLPESYTDVEGIVTFRGNNFRDNPTYGTVQFEEYGFSDDYWTINTGSLQSPSGAVWTGSGWVGQPLVMTWPKDVRQHMNMHSWAKEAEKLTEVIYATMDGNIYFMELQTGKKTRDDLNLGFTFKGSGALDPRGYPIMYLGAGYDSSKGRARAFIINLLDCSVMYEFGNGDPFALRTPLSFFDGSALVDAENDRLIYPGENGVLYIMDLNTNYDREAGTLSVAPSNVVRWRYKSTRSEDGTHWLGMEDSAIIYRGHIIMSDNGGNLMCLNLNTLQLEWVQDVLDDTNCTPVFEIEDGHPYVYTSTSFHGGWRAPMDGQAPIPIWKIDAVTGEIMWKKEYNCYTQDGVSGGVQGTLAIGKGSLSDLIFVPVAMTPERPTGILVALNKKTGEVVWEKQTQTYTWSSPVCVYDQDGKGYVILCTFGGYIHLLDGLTGEPIDFFDMASHVEASPIVYNNYMVIGTRNQKIFGIKLC